MIGESIAAIRKERGFTQEQLTQVVTHRLEPSAATTALS